MRPRLFDDFLPYLIARLAYQLNGDLSAKLRREGINITRWRILAVLAMGDGITVNEIVERSMLQQSALSRALMRMEREKLVRRKLKTQDARCVEVYLTRKGRNLFHSLNLIVRRRQHRLLRGFSARQAAAAFTMIRRLSRNMRSLALASAIAMGAVCAPNARADDVGLRTIAVDATVAVGALRPLSGVNGVTGIDGTGFYRDARVDLIRIPDDYGPGDVDEIFPDLNADPDDPKSYNFAPTDRLIGAIKAAGAEPLFHLGRRKGAPADPPADPDKFARIAGRIVLHYNQGWSKGFRHAIRYWEIWNEPDSRLSWTGSPQQYYELYEKTARAIQAADPQAEIGGPALSKPLDGGAYREGLIDFIRLNRLPLAFFSWHFFPLDVNDPYDFVTIARQLRIILDTRGFGSARNVLDGWNADLSARDMPGAARAAFAAGALIYMLGGPVDHQAFYRGDSPLYAPDGAANATGHALAAFGALKDTPVLLHTEGGDDAGFAIVAGRSANGRLVQILIANYQVSEQSLGSADARNVALPVRRTLIYRDNGGYDATITLPKSGKYRVKRYRIGENANFALVDQSLLIGPSIHLQAALPPPGVELIVISGN